MTATDADVTPFDGWPAHFGSTTSRRQSAGRARTGYFPVELDGRSFPPAAGEWKTHHAGMRTTCCWPTGLQSTGNSLSYVRYLDDFPAFPIDQRLGRHWQRSESGRPKGLCCAVVVQRRFERCLLMTTDPGDLVLDPTCGAGTTASSPSSGAAGGSRSTPRGRHRAGPPAADGCEASRTTCSPTPRRASAKEQELSGRPAPTDRHRRRHPQGLRLPARPARDAQVDRQQPRHRRGHEPRPRSTPRSPGTPRPRCSTTSPTRTSKKVRVAGPFTVESVSPHRTASFDAEIPASEQAAEQLRRGRLPRARSTITCSPPACRTAAGPSG